MISENKKGEPKVILFSGSKGGCGCSFISYCVATYFARKTPKNILLLDLNLGKKDSRLIFNSTDEEHRDLGDIEEIIEELDISILKKLVINKENSLNLILPPVKIERSGVLDNGNFNKLLEGLKDHFDIICIDFPVYLFNQNGFDLEDLIDKFIFISLPDLISVNNLNLLMTNIAYEKFPVGFDILINKFNTRPSISPTGLTAILKYPVNAFIPYDRDIEFLFLNKGPDSIFNYNLRIVRNIIDFSKKIYEDLFI